MSQQQQLPLKLTNPTPYHILASASYNNSTHPLSEDQPPVQLDSFSYNKESPDHRYNVKFNDSFSQHTMNPMSSPLSNDFDDAMEYQKNHGLHDRGSFSSVTFNNPLEIHRRSSTATDISMHNNPSIYNQQQPVYIPGNPYDSHQNGSMAASAPANMYEYPTQIQGLSVESNKSGTVVNDEAVKSFEEEYALQMSMQLVLEKRRRRRESHNAVERRRRDNINDRIQELGDLLPDTSLDSANLGPNNKPNKGVILKKSVDHIRQLQLEVQAYRQRVAELENTLKMYQQ